jgi:hypothetical protein
LLAMGLVLIYVRRFQNQMCRAHVERYCERLERHD